MPPSRCFWPASLLVWWDVTHIPSTHLQTNQYKKYIHLNNSIIYWINDKWISSYCYYLNPCPVYLFWGHGKHLFKNTRLIACCNTTDCVFVDQLFSAKIFCVEGKWREKTPGGLWSTCNKYNRSFKRFVHAQPNFITSLIDPPNVNESDRHKEIYQNQQDILI